jgi:hypothetical protein
MKGLVGSRFWEPPKAPNGEPNQALLAAEASLRLVTSLAQAKLRFAHLQLRLKQQLLRSKDRNGNCSYRDSDVEIPVTDPHRPSLRRIYCCLASAPLSVIKSTDSYLVICPRNIPKALILNVMRLRNWSMSF